MLNKKILINILIFCLLLGIFLPVTLVNADSDDSVEDFITRLYRLTLGREPDHDGLVYWFMRLAAADITGAEISEYFIFSKEFTEKNVSDSDFLDIMYRAFFNREPDEGGKIYWLGKMNEGYSRRYILANFVNSKEFIEICNNFGIIPGQIVLSDSDKKSVSSDSNTNNLQNELKNENKINSTETSRNNPANKGQTVIINRDDWFYGKATLEMELKDVISGEEAWNIIKEANMFNSEPEDGKEYILAKFRVKVIYVEKEPFEISHVLFDAVSGSGIAYDDFISVAGLEPDLSTDLYQDAEYEGWTYFLVDENDPNPLVVFDRKRDSETWFKLK